MSIVKSLSNIIRFSFWGSKILFWFARLKKSAFANPFSLSGFKFVGLRWALSVGKGAPFWTRLSEAGTSLEGVLYWGLTVWKIPEGDKAEEHSLMIPSLNLGLQGFMLFIVKSCCTRTFIHTSFWKRCSYWMMQWTCECGCRRAQLWRAIRYDLWWIIFYHQLLTKAQ
jgi:hypothetical protein